MHDRRSNSGSSSNAVTMSLTFQHEFGMGVQTTVQSVTGKHPVPYKACLDMVIIGGFALFLTKKKVKYGLCPSCEVSFLA